MFIRASSLFFALVTLAVAISAAPEPIIGRDTSDSQCDTGAIQCCSETMDATSSTASTLATLLGIVLGPVDGLIGVGCTPVTVVGTGSGAVCTQQPVCCTGNTENGLVNLGCSPININL